MALLTKKAETEEQPDPAMRERERARLQEVLRTSVSKAELTEAREALARLDEEDRLDRLIAEREAIARQREIEEQRRAARAELEAELHGALRGLCAVFDQEVVPRAARVREIVAEFERRSLGRPENWVDLVHLVSAFWPWTPMGGGGLYHEARRRAQALGVLGPVS